MTSKSQDMPRLQAAIEELSAAPARGFFPISLALASGLEAAFKRHRTGTGLLLIRLALVRRHARRHSTYRRGTAARRSR